VSMCNGQDRAVRRKRSINGGINAAFRASGRPDEWPRPHPRTAARGNRVGNENKENFGRTEVIAAVGRHPVRHSGSDCQWRCKTRPRAENGPLHEEGKDAHHRFVNGAPNWLDVGSPTSTAPSPSTAVSSLPRLPACRTWSPAGSGETPPIGPDPFHVHGREEDRAVRLHRPPWPWPPRVHSGIDGPGRRAWSAVTGMPPAAVLPSSWKKAVAAASVRRLEYCSRRDRRRRRWRRRCRTCRPSSRFWSAVWTKRM